MWPIAFNVELPLESVEELNEKGWRYFDRDVWKWYSMDNMQKKRKLKSNLSADTSFENLICKLIHRH